ncbi:hypothetical protein [Campylobacter sp.]|uniref:hypothetical protein n=1 Tax=Campylobacter sp. TaxID=205 RepID=UPI00270130D7|nr:hypothetical protein [Campylobacter sp.]
MKRHLFAFVVLCLLVFVCISGFMLWDYANSNLAQVMHDENHVEKTERIDDGKKANLWVNELANLPQKEYILATNEIFIEFKDKISSKSGSIYQLIIDKDDIYSMFCLTQTLKNILVDFSIVRQNSTNLIYLNTQDKDVLNHVINELKTYDIHSNIKEIKL